MNSFIGIGAFQLVRPIDVGLAVLATLLRLTVEKDGGSCFGDEEEVDDLDGAANVELHPEDPESS